MAESRAVYQLYVGVDIAAVTFVAAWLAPGGKPGTPFTGEQTPAGFAALQRRLQATGHPPTATLVVLEATGNYWVALAVVLHEAGYQVAVVNPLSWPLTPSGLLCWRSRRASAKNHWRTE